MFLLVEVLLLNLLSKVIAFKQKFIIVIILKLLYSNFEHKILFSEQSISMENNNYSMEIAPFHSN